MKLAHDVGYWDTWPDAIGEDMHMFIKAFLRTNGATHLHPIHAPINMTHVQGPTYVRSLWARFMQVRNWLSVALRVDGAVLCAWAGTHSAQTVSTVCGVMSVAGLS